MTDHIVSLIGLPKLRKEKVACVSIIKFAEEISSELPRRHAVEANAKQKLRKSFNAKKMEACVRRFD